MKNKASIYGFLVVFIVISVMVSGCITQERDGDGDGIVGNDSDEHGCIGSAGYIWCESKQKCLRTWEEECPAVAMCESVCKSNGGNWNECSNRCKLDNRGKSGVVCTTVCEALCECGGIAGFKCPGGYNCKTPDGVADALGYCIKETVEPGYDTIAEDKALKIAKDYVMNMTEYPDWNGSELKITNVLRARCPGCWVIDIEFYMASEKDPERIDKAKVKITLGDWKVVDVVYARGSAIILTNEECTKQDGRVVNTAGGYACDDNETNSGDVKGFTSPNVCCVKKETGCPEDAKVCPDGTVVTRIAPGCEFGPCPGEKMNIKDAVKIALESECAEKGVLSENYTYNNISKTWWIDLNMKNEFKKEFCNPACVVSEETKTADINWRCTGAIPPDDHDTSNRCIHSKTGDSMTISEAIQIASKSKCSGAGNLTEYHICDPDTGVWWIGIDITLRGCSPICAVNITSKTAEINWRCMGAS